MGPSNRDRLNRQRLSLSRLRASSVGDALEGLMGEVAPKTRPSRKQGGALEGLMGGPSYKRRERKDPFLWMKNDKSERDRLQNILEGFNRGSYRVLSPDEQLERRNTYGNFGNFLLSASDAFEQGARMESTISPTPVMKTTDISSARALEGLTSRGGEMLGIADVAGRPGNVDLTYELGDLIYAAGSGSLNEGLAEIISFIKDDPELAAKMMGAGTVAWASRLMSPGNLKTSEYLYEGLMKAPIVDKGVIKSMEGEFKREPDVADVTDFGLGLATGGFKTPATGLRALSAGARASGRGARAVAANVPVMGLGAGGFGVVPRGLLREISERADVNDTATKERNIPLGEALPEELPGGFVPEDIIPQYTVEDLFNNTDTVMGDAVGRAEISRDKATQAYNRSVSRINGNKNTTIEKKRQLLKAAREQYEASLQEGVTEFQLGPNARELAKQIARGNKDAIDVLSEEIESFDPNNPIILRIMPQPQERIRGNLASQVSGRDEFKDFLNNLESSGAITPDQKKELTRSARAELKRNSNTIMRKNKASEAQTWKIEIEGVSESGERSILSIKDDPDHIISQAKASKIGNELISTSAPEDIPQWVSDISPGRRQGAARAIARFVNSKKNFQPLYEKDNRYAKRDKDPVIWRKEKQQQAPDDPLYEDGGFYDRRARGAFDALDKELKREGIPDYERRIIIERIRAVPDKPWPNF